jgi:hypothetical protein
LLRAGFRVVATHPIKAEMSVAAPKQQAKDPIDVDVIVVCRRALGEPKPDLAGPRDVVARAVSAATGQIRRFNDCGREMGRGDVRVILNAHLLRLISGVGEERAASALLEKCVESAHAQAEALFSEQEVKTEERPVEPVTLELALA